MLGIVIKLTFLLLNSLTLAFLPLNSLILPIFVNKFAKLGAFQKGLAADSFSQFSQARHTYKNLSSKFSGSPAPPRVQEQNGPSDQGQGYLIRGRIFLSKRPVSRLGCSLASWAL